MKKYKAAICALAAALLMLSACDPAPSPGVSASPPPPSGVASPGIPEPVQPSVSPAPPQSPEPPSPSPVRDISEDWQDNGLDVSNISFAKTYGDSSSPVLDASAAFPQTGVAGIDQYFSFCRDDFERRADGMSSEAAQAVQNGYGPYSFDSDYNVECSSGGIFSVSRRASEYTGGVHGMTFVFCENFSVSTGRLLTLDDFFTVDQPAYTARLVGELHRLIDAYPGELFGQESKDIVEQAFPYDSFVVTKDGLSFIFEPYRIGPYSAGIVRLDIGWAAIYDIWQTPA